MWDEEEEADDGKQKTPKQRLLGWIQNKLPELPITNFNRDWQTGRALGALVDSCAPGEAKFVFWGSKMMICHVECVVSIFAHSKGLKNTECYHCG